MKRALVAAGLGAGVATAVVLVAALRGESSAAAPALAPAPAVDGRVRVEVLNAGGVPRVAREATDLLRDAGFDVVGFGNAGAWDRVESEVLQRAGSLDFAESVADALGIDNVRSEPDPNLYLEVSVLLGSDWLPPTAADETAVSRRRWWDPRGWLER